MGNGQPYRRPAAGGARRVRVAVALSASHGFHNCFREKFWRKQVAVNRRVAQRERDQLLVRLAGRCATRQRRPLRRRQHTITPSTLPPTKNTNTADVSIGS